MPRRSPNLDLNNWLDSHGYRHSHASKKGLSTPAVPSSKPCKCAEPWVTVERPTPCRVCGGTVEDAEEFPKQGHSRIIHQPPTGRPVFAAHERDHHITTSGRRALDHDQFALPPGPEEKRRGIKGRLPIDTIKRARNALQRASQMQKRGHITAVQLAEVQRAVHRAWPSIESTHAHATMKGGAKARALALSPTLVAEKYRPFSKSAKWLWWIHLPESVATLGKGDTEAKAWQDAALRLEGELPPIITSSHATIAKRGPANVKLGDKFRHDGGVWQVTRIAGGKITMTSEVADLRDPFNFEKSLLIERVWPQNALSKMSKINP